MAINVTPALQQGQIWWAEIPSAQSPESYRRPVLVLQSASFNDSVLDTVVCVALSGNWRLAEAPGNVLLAQADCGLREAHVVTIPHLVTLDRRFLREYVQTVPAYIMESILDGVQLLFGR